MKQHQSSVKLIGEKNNKEIDLPVLAATEGPRTLDIGKLHQSLGYFTFDPGFVSTASCESKITYTDGNKGLLQYRGYSIEQLAEHSNFTEVAYLLYYGELPNPEQLEEFNRLLAQHAPLDLDILANLQRVLPKDAHPMAMLMTAMSVLAAQYQKEKDIQNPEYHQVSFLRILAKMPAITAWALRHQFRKKPLAADPRLPYTKNLLRMMFGSRDKKLTGDAFVQAMDLILTLHADHEQNASTSAVRVIGSTETSPYAAVVGGLASLWGPAHGGANEAVVKMLEDIVSSGRPIEHYISRAKDKKDAFRLMGFGHRVYKHYDPRAKILRQTCYDLLAELDPENHNQPLLDTAMKLEAIALEDEYFISRKLYPNVDFYSGIIFSAMKLPCEMFTAIFALARTAGWMSHWREMMLEGHTRIYRPRQLYTGSTRRDYVPIENR
jgi:citrate synthase